MGQSRMEAGQWISNSTTVLSEIPDKDGASEIVINDGQNPMTKMLGIA